MSVLPKVKKTNKYKSVFGNKFFDVVFKNYGRVPTYILAKVLQTEESKIDYFASKLGLKGVKYNAKWTKRGYIKLIYDNWQLLPYSQLLPLLQLSRKKLAFILKEEDFLGEKLGGFKPYCQRVVYNNKLEKFDFTEKLKIVENFRLADSKEFDFQYQPLCDGKIFVNNCTDLDIAESVYAISKAYGQSSKRKPTIYFNAEYKGEQFEISGSDVYVGSTDGVLRGLQEYYGGRGKDGVYKPKTERRIIYNYECSCCDILDIDVDEFYSEQLLCNYFRKKINGIFLHAIFYQLVEFPFCKALSKGYQKRLAVLKEIISRCEKYGIKLYLYINEPRGLPEKALNAQTKALFGYSMGGQGSMCTSLPQVKDYLRYASESIAKALPNLGGFISITMSENLTHCRSKGHNQCPRCKDRGLDEVVCEINNLIAKGVKNSGNDIDVIEWTWAWIPELGFNDALVDGVIKNTDKSVAIMCTSEDSMVLEGGDIITDYSFAHPGPSEKTLRTFRLAKSLQNKLYAKIQTNNSWECPSVPYIPVFPLQCEHVEKLKQFNLKGTVFSWTLGGYPGTALGMASEMSYSGKSFLDVMTEKYGSQTQQMIRASDKLSRLFAKLPVCTMFLYVGPMSRGPALKMYKDKQEGQSSMIGYVYDDYEYWLMNTDKEQFISKLEKVVNGLDDAVAQFPDGEEKRLATVAGCIFTSAYNYLTFSIGKEKERLINELDNVKKLFGYILQDGRIGYEASNHYLFTARDLVEKIIQLEEEIRVYDD